MNRYSRAVAAALICVSVFVVALPIAALGGEDVPLVNGELWTKSSHAEKLSYLAGAQHLMVVEYLFQNGSRQVPTDDQTVIQRLYKGLDGQTLTVWHSGFGHHIYRGL